MRLAGENRRNVTVTYEARRSIQVLLNLRKHSKRGHSHIMTGEIMHIVTIGQSAAAADACDTSTMIEKDRGLPRIHAPHTQAHFGATRS